MIPKPSDASAIPYPCLRLTGFVLCTFSFYSTDNDILGNDDALARFSVANIADEILESSGYGRAITAPDSRIFAIVSDKEDMGGILLEILDNIYTFLRLSVTLAVSPMPGH